METIRRYTLDGMELRIPLRYDARAGVYIEDYREFIEKTIRTPGGRPVLFAGEDACPFGEEDGPGGCPDCGSCRFYCRAAEHTWIGICQNENNAHTRTLPPTKEVI